MAKLGRARIGFSRTTSRASLSHAPPLRWPTDGSRDRLARFPGAHGGQIPSHARHLMADANDNRIPYSLYQVRDTREHNSPPSSAHQKHYLSTSPRTAALPNLLFSRASVPPAFCALGELWRGAPRGHLQKSCRRLPQQRYSRYHNRIPTQ